MYCLDPTGAQGGSNVSGGGLVQLTGGTVLAHENHFTPAAEAIWRAAGHYHPIGYWPSAAKRDLHAVDVSVARKGVKVRARQRRS